MADGAGVAIVHNSEMGTRVEGRRVKLYKSHLGSCDDVATQRDRTE